MRQAPARSEQTEPAQVIDFHSKRRVASRLNLRTQIVNRALTAAVLAPTVYDALDICSKALLELGELAIATEGLRHE